MTGIANTAQNMTGIANTAQNLTGIAITAQITIYIAISVYELTKIYSYYIATKGSFWWSNKKYYIF